VPIGACLTRGVAAEVIQPGNHGSTFGGNPLACRAGYTVLESMLQSSIADNAAARGAQLASELREGLTGHPNLVEVRHLGLLLAVELNLPCQPLVAIALERGLLINVTANSVIRLLPPLIIDAAQTSEIASTLIARIHQFTG